jgi:drug/metabolite transporter (DMT)-like permease
MPSEPKHLPILDILLPGLLLGSSLVSTRFSLGQFAPLTHVALRLSIAALVFVVAILVFRARPFPTGRQIWICSMIYGLIGTAITMSTFTLSLRYQSTGVTSLLASLSPVVTALLAHWLLHDEPLNRYRVLGALVAFSGAGLLLIRGESGLHELSRADWRGYAWALVGMLSNSAGLVYARRYLKSADPMTVTAIRILTGAVVIAGLNGLLFGYDFSKVQVSGVLTLLYAAIAGTVFAFLLYLTSVQRNGATVASQTEYIVPLVATGLGVLLLHEHVTPAMLVGMGLIFVGLAVFDRGRGARVEQVVAIEEM